MSHINGARRIAEILDAADPARCLRFLLQLLVRDPSNSVRDRGIREMTEGRTTLLQGQASPVWLRLAALDGRFSDTQENLGKIVVIAIVPLAWEEMVGFLRDDRREYHPRGVVTIPGDRRRYPAQW